MMSPMWPFKKKSPPADLHPTATPSTDVPRNKNHYLIMLSERDELNTLVTSFESQSEIQRVFSAVYKVEARVNGDGFDGVFRTIEPDMIRFAPTALRAIGATACAEIVAEAIAIVEPSVGPDDDWEEAVDELVDEEDEDSVLERLDQRFYQYPDDLTILLFDYVKSHPETFGEVPPEITKRDHLSA
jgi:hypothetical protein